MNNVAAAAARRPSASRQIPYENTATKAKSCPNRHALERRMGPADGI